MNVKICAGKITLDAFIPKMLLIFMRTTKILYKFSQHVL